MGYPRVFRDVTHLGSATLPGSLAPTCVLGTLESSRARVPPPSFSFETEFEFHVSLVLKRIRFDSS
jgi:hypothetical protein